MVKGRPDKSVQRLRNLAGNILKIRMLNASNHIGRFKTACLRKRSKYYRPSQRSDGSLLAVHVLQDSFWKVKDKGQLHLFLRILKSTTQQSQLHGHGFLCSKIYPTNLLMYLLTFIL